MSSELLTTRHVLNDPQTIPSVVFATNERNRFSRVPWGEEMHVRLSSTDTNGALSIMDITAPAGPGTPRHLHHREHEVLRIVSGQIVVWTPERSFAIGPGELASLPKGVPHAWRPYGGQPVKFILNCFPGGFEHIFPTIIERGITLEDVAELSQVAKEFGIDIVGPTLSDEEVESILRGANV